MGAIASGGVVVNDDVGRGFHLSPEVIARVAEEESRELLRGERIHHEGRPPIKVRGKTVIVVDDGLATGASMRATIHALCRLLPGQLVVAVPVAPSPPVSSSLTRSTRWGG